MPRFRPTARLIPLDPAGRILLFSATDPRGQVWFTPGGGVPAVPVRLPWG